LLSCRVGHAQDVATDGSYWAVSGPQGELLQEVFVMKGVLLSHRLLAVLMAFTVSACTQQITAKSNPFSYLYPPDTQKVVTPAPTQL